MSTTQRIPLETVKTVEELSALCHDTGDVIFLTKGNEVDVVAMSMELYQSQVAGVPISGTSRQTQRETGEDDG